MKGTLLGPVVCLSIKQVQGEKHGYCEECLRHNGGIPKERAVIERNLQKNLPCGCQAIGPKEYPSQEDKMESQNQFDALKYEVWFELQTIDIEMVGYVICQTMRNQIQTV